MAFVDVPLWSLAKARKDSFGFRGIRAIDDNKALSNGHLSAWLFPSLTSDAPPKANGLGQQAEDEGEDVAGDPVKNKANSPNCFEDGFRE
jgi:hypothetical protein